MRHDDPRFNRAKNNAAEIVNICEKALKDRAFLGRKGTTLWRPTNLKFDILKFDIIPRTRCEKWRVPFGSFGLQPSCLFPFLPRVSRAANGDTLRPEVGFGQIRLSINRGIPQSIVKAPNIWWAGDNIDVFDLVVKDVLRQINEK